MMTMAIFTIGANQVQVAKMVDYARNTWEFAGSYSDTRRILDDGKAGRFSYVLVFDYEALDAAAQRQLRGLGIEVVCFRDRAALERAAEKEREKRERAEKERRVRLEFEKDLAIIKV